MAEDNRASEWDKRIADIDAIAETPAERARRIWSILQQHAPNETNWDVLCFCVEYIGMLVPEWPWLEDVAKPLAKRVYTAHYFKEGLYDAAQSSTGQRTSKPTESDDRSPDMGGEQKENSSRIILPSGIIGGGKKKSEPSLHIRDNPAQSAEDSSSQATGNDVGGDSGSNAG